MSFDALAWAAKCNPGSPARKLVLLALAECAQRETNMAFRSLAALGEFTSLNRKTIITALDDLEATGFIADSGERTGRTKQVKVYHLTLEAVPKPERSQKRNGSVSSGKESQKRDTELVTEPVKHTARARVIPSNWKPEAFSADSKCRKIIESWSADEHETQIEHFTAHHRGKGNRFVDWQDAWKTWVLNSRKWGASRGPPRQPSTDANDFLAHFVAKDRPA